MAKPLYLFVAKMSDDSAQRELDLICEDCGERICTIEHGDTLEVLVNTTEEHMCSKEPS